MEILHFLPRISINNAHPEEHSYFSSHLNFKIPIPIRKISFIVKKQALHPDSRSPQYTLTRHFSGSAGTDNEVRLSFIKRPADAFDNFLSPNDFDMFCTSIMQG